MDGNSLRLYIEKYHSTLFRLAITYTKNSHDAEDIVQEAFLKLYCTENSFKTDENVKAWLIRVTVNLCKDMVKSKWRKERSELIMDIPCEDEKESILLDVLNKLKPEQRMIIVLFYYEGYHVKEIAEICGISATTATTRLSRARKMLKKLLLEEGYNEK